MFRRGAVTANVAKLFSFPSPRAKSRGCHWHMWNTSLMSATSQAQALPEQLISVQQAPEYHLSCPWQQGWPMPSYTWALLNCPGYRTESSNQDPSFQQCHFSPKCLGNVKTKEFPSLPGDFCSSSRDLMISSKHNSHFMVLARNRTLFTLSHIHV